MFGKIYTIKKLNVKELCMVAALISVTVILSYISGFLRIGNIAKFSVSFISVYVAATAFGPFIGGFVAISADFISHIVNQAGVYLWQIALIELIYGVIFGLLFCRKEVKTFSKKSMLARVTLCTVLQFVINLFLKTYVLMTVGYAPSPYAVGLWIRLPGCAVMAALQFAVLILFERFICTFLYMIRGEH